MIGLWLQVFTSASTVIFTTFACDSEAVEGESFLRADYSISCDTDKHTIFKVYAGVMILVRGRQYHPEESQRRHLIVPFPFVASC